MNTWATSMTKEIQMKNKILFIITIFLFLASVSSIPEKKYENMFNV